MQLLSIKEELLSKIISMTRVDTFQFHLYFNTFSCIINPVLGLYPCNDSFSFARTGPLLREIRSSRLIKAIHNDAVTRFVRA